MPITKLSNRYAKTNRLVSAISNVTLIVHRVGVSKLCGKISKGLRDRHGKGDATSVTQQCACTCRAGSRYFIITGHLSRTLFSHNAQQTNYCYLYTRFSFNGLTDIRADRVTNIRKP